MQTEEAKLTPLGIQFRGNYYTCSHAIRMGWFHRSSTQEYSPVSVWFQEFCLPELIYIQTEDALLECRRVAPAALPDALLLAQYQKQLQQMKEARRSGALRHT